MKQIVILGAGYAGLMAALRLSNRMQRGQAHITLINAHDTFNERIRLHQVASGQQTRTHRIKDLLRGKPVTFLQAMIRDLDPKERLVRAENADGVHALRYDTLVYALGSMVNRDALQGAHQHAYTLDPASAQELRAALPAIAARGGRLAVIGGGLTGIEAAAEFAERFPSLKVMMFTRGRVAAGLSRKGQDYLYATFAALNIEVRENSDVQQIRAGEVVTAGGITPVDAILWTGGFVANPLARKAGLTVNARGQILVDAMLRSVSHPDIFAAGDAASVAMQDDVSLRMACAVALPLGAHTGENIAALLAGTALQPFSFAYAVQCVSLGRKRGLLQVVNSDDSPQERIVTGWKGAIAKELICQYTTLSLKMERNRWWLMQWPHIHHARQHGALAASSMD